MESKKFVLDSVANKRGFDSLIAKNWYNVSCADILKFPVCLIPFSHLLLLIIYQGWSITIEAL
jgi:hypothetical protein